jgi:hypothetical protein
MSVVAFVADSAAVRAGPQAAFFAKNRAALPVRGVGRSVQTTGGPAKVNGYSFFTSTFERRPLAS